MNPKHPHHPGESDADGELPDRLPDAILERLHGPSTAPVTIDEHVDRAVLDAARAHFAGREAKPRADAADLRRPQGVGAGARPANGAGVGAGFLFRRRAGPRRAGARGRRVTAGLATVAVALVAALLVQPMLFRSTHPDDIDGSGRVDILDAFALARMRAAGATVSEPEIDALAMRIVALEPSGRSR